MGVNIRTVGFWDVIPHSLVDRKNEGSSSSPLQHESLDADGSPVRHEVYCLIVET